MKLPPQRYVSSWKKCVRVYVFVGGWGWGWGEGGGGEEGGGGGWWGVGGWGFEGGYTPHRTHGYGYMVGSTVYWSISQRPKYCISIQILITFPIGATNIKLSLVKSISWYRRNDTPLLEHLSICASPAYILCMSCSTAIETRLMPINDVPAQYMPYSITNYSSVYCEYDFPCKK